MLFVFFSRQITAWICFGPMELARITANEKKLLWGTATKDTVSARWIDMFCRCGVNRVGCGETHKSQCFVVSVVRFARRCEFRHRFFFSSLLRLGLKSVMPDMSHKFTLKIPQNVDKVPFYSSIWLYVLEIVGYRGISIIARRRR